VLTAVTEETREDLREALFSGLRTRATTRDRVRALLALISAKYVAAATGVSINTVRNWSAGKAEPRPDAALTLDDLRTVADTLLRGGMEPDEAANWLISRNPDSKIRPIEEIGANPTEVIANAVDESLEGLVANR
jgi:DNA-binding transcriptional regulator YiaG